MRTRRLALTSALLCLVVAGCSSGPEDPRGDTGAAGSAPTSRSGPAYPSPTYSVAPGAPMPTKVPAADGLVTTGEPALVISRGGSTPEVCLGAILTSLPPGCGGPKLVGFDWDDFPGSYQDYNKVRTGSYALTGGFDGARLYVRTVVPMDEYDGPETIRRRGTPDLSTRCPEPAGGWRIVDEEKATGTAAGRAMRVARALPGYAEFWYDRSIESVASVVNVAVAEDRDAAEQALREAWGGALCVSETQHSARELQGIARKVFRMPGAHTAAVRLDEVHLRLLYDDGSLQAWLDATYGPGLVTITSALIPAT